MDRSAYKIFTEGVIAGLTVPNRLVRSATWDPSILGSRQMTGDVLDLYRNLALGGIGLIITGGFPVYRERFPEEETDKPARLYADLRVNGLEKMAQVVRQASPDCKIIAQLEVGYLDAGPSSIVSQASDQIKAWENGFINKRCIRWGIARKDDRVLIGSCGYYGFHTWHKRHRLDMSWRVHFGVRAS
jgi:2,4-dienoyl-CoA reductase-like NADH-dependent reductase (Old Yellow Enzyme family)